jgi:hypothetical protein
MLTPADNETIMRAAVADRAFWHLLGRCDDATRKRALLERRVVLDAQLRGARRPPAPAPLWAPLEEAVNVELERRRDLVRVELTLRRQRSRLGLGCGLVQLALGRRARARRSIRAMAHAASLSLREFAAVLGVEYRTVLNHLGSRRRISATRLDWYGRLEAIEVRGAFIHLVIRYHPTRKRAGWKLPKQRRQG